ncbi:MAG: S-adenosylmethionine decarboxylase, partial [Thaumarchaeota archaeon]|nr:S-adenosylmethionine decarboxylase [Nitrososphaerota archaeon]
MGKMKVLGRHIIAELHGCDPGLLTDLDKTLSILRGAVQAAGATYLGEFHKVFEPWGGVTAIIALAESHISIHTWPEYR